MSLIFKRLKMGRRLMFICYFSLFYNLSYAQLKLSDTSFVAIKNLSNDFVFDLKYATENNFIKQKIYDCAECYIRYEVALALIKANADFMKKGYKIIFFDCYRPFDVQKKMWSIYPNSKYVANPNKGGSMHNKGGAIDITLVDMNGNELDMGTAFDHFGIEAHHSCINFSEKILENRKLLKSVMENNGFKSLATEWWHYDFKFAKKYPISNFPVKCQ